MSTFPTKILLATDGSQEAELAAHVAIGLADATDSELHITYVGLLPKFLDSGPRGRDYNRTVYEEVRLESEKMLRKLAWRTKVAGGTVAGAHLRLGGVVQEIVDLADELGAGLIVIGDRGHARIKSLLVSSVSDSVIRHARCSVLVVRGHGPGEKVQAYPPVQILLAFDGSKASLEAARAATEIAHATDSELHVAYVLQPDRYKPYPGPEMWEGWQEGLERAKRHARSWVEGQAERIRGEGVKVVEAHLLIGRPDAGIVWLAEKLGTDLIVMGRRSHGRITRVLTGSVSDSVIRHAHCPVLVMRPREKRSSRNEMSA